MSLELSFGMVIFFTLNEVLDSPKYKQKKVRISSSIECLA